jgi:hypothetical protein
MPERCTGCPALNCPLIAQLGCPARLQARSRGIFLYPDHSQYQRWNDCLIKPPKKTCEPRTYDCPIANVCSWQKLCGPTQLCPQRDALQLGVDPRVCFIEFDGKSY